MAPNISAIQHEIIEGMIRAGKYTQPQIAEVAQCSTRTVKRICANLRHFGSTTAPHNGGGCQPVLTPVMRDALREYLVEKPTLFRDELALRLWDDFDEPVSTSTIGQALRTMKWSKKTACRVAAQRHPDLRDAHQHKLSEISSYHVVCIDESGCDTRVGFRRSGWAPLGVTPVQVARYGRGQRYHILPAYTQDGILLSRVFQGSTDSAVFEDFIEQLLPLCGRWPEPKSVLMMDNASFHRSDRIRQMCADAGIILIYLPPYSPDFNPIEVFFAELKAFIKKEWKVFEANPEPDFGAFLTWCVEVVGQREGSAKGHFRHAGIAIEEF